jgi:hypothetical protein
VVSVAARGDVAVALQLAAFGILLWHASIANAENGGTADDRSPDP